MVANGFSTLLRQIHVVFITAAAIRVASHFNVHTSPFIQGSDIAVDDGDVFRTQGGETGPVRLLSPPRFNAAQHPGGIGVVVRDWLDRAIVLQK